MKFTIRNAFGGEKTLEGSVMEIVDFQRRSKWGSAVTEFFKEFFDIYKGKSSEQIAVSILKEHNQDALLGRAFFTDEIGNLTPTDFVFEPAFVDRGDGVMELQEISLVLRPKPECKGENCECKKKGKKKT